MNLDVDSKREVIPTCEHNILKMNEATSCQLAHKWSIGQWHEMVRFGGQRSRTYEAEDRLGGLVKGRAGFLVLLI